MGCGPVRSLPGAGRPLDGKDHVHESKVTHCQWCTSATAQTTQPVQMIEKWVRKKAALCVCVCVRVCMCVCACLACCR